MRLDRLGLLVAGLLGASLTPAFPIDCNENGIDDAVEILEGGTDDCNQNGIPDACDVLPLGFGFVPRDVGFIGETNSMVLAKLDGDDLVELITWTTNALLVYRNNGAGGLEAFWSRGFGATSVGGGALVDMDRDGDLDIIVFFAFVASDPQIYLNDGNARFAEAGTLPIGEEVRSVEAGDLDGDGHGDLAVVTVTRLVTFTNDAGGAGFTERASIALGPELWGLTIGRFNGDQHLDVALVRSLAGFPGTVDVFFGTGGALLRAAGTYATGRGSRTITGADMNGDGLTDLITADFDDLLGTGDIDAAGFSILSNAGEGVFEPSRSFILGRPVAEPAPADLDRDGDVDLIVSRGPFVASDVVLYSNQGDGDLLPGTVPISVESFPLPLRLAVPGDIDGDGDPDLVSADIMGRLLILENRPIILSTDCNGSGVPDECEPDAGPRDCLDCNQNGVPDHRDLASRDSRDENGNGVPDECEGEPSWVIGFDGPCRAAGAPGSIVSIPVTAQIHSLGLDPGEPCLQGWSVMVAAGGADIADITTEGTVARPAPEGLIVNGFEITGWVSGTRCDMQAGSAVVLSFVQPVTLDVTGSPHDIFRMTLESKAPAAGASVVTVRVIPGHCGASLQRTRPGDGDGGGASGVITALTHRGKTVEPVLRAKRITVFAAGGFHRGDVNDDGRLDISDPIRLLQKLFLGGTDLPCRDAADSNDDGRLDVSDAIRLFSFLFLGGGPPPYPGPPGSPCGEDPSGPDGDEGCEAYTSC